MMLKVKRSKGEKVKPVVLRYISSVKRCVLVGSLSLLHLFISSPLHAQELQAKININHSQIQGTDVSVFENLKQTLEQFVNERQWTDLQFQKVYNSAYTTTLYNNRDDNFQFEFVQFDQLNYNDETIDNQLTALFAYYAYLIIGLDLDSFAPLGGTDILQKCVYLVNNAQDLGFPGWKLFEDSRNRFAIINDYMDESMKPFRQLQYDYYRKGLDEMANNAERGRTEISNALENGLKTSHENKPLSLLPQIWTDYKKDELKNIYNGKGTQKEKERIYDMLMSINASQSNTWDDIRK